MCQNIEDLLFWGGYTFLQVWSLYLWKLQKKKKTSKKTENVLLGFVFKQEYFFIFCQGKWKNR